MAENIGFLQEEFLCKILFRKILYLHQSIHLIEIL